MGLHFEHKYIILAQCLPLCREGTINPRISLGNESLRRWHSILHRRSSPPGYKAPDDQDKTEQAVQMKSERVSYIKELNFVKLFIKTM